MRLAHLRGTASDAPGAVLPAGALIAALVPVRSVETTWSFSASTVLVYCALTSLAPSRLPAQITRRRGG
jgi:APA family basic amino acid/polyamine antiporter